MQKSIPDAKFAYITHKIVFFRQNFVYITRK